MITLDDFLDKYLGQTKGYPTDNEYKGECLSIVKLYIKECFGISPPASGTNSAYGYWSNFPNPLPTVFDKVENTPDLIPKKGWIVIWKPWSANQYGHIGIVASGSTASVCKNYAQNWTSKKFQLESNNYTNIIGFLVPKVNNSNNNMTLTDDQKRILQFLTEQKANEGKVREAFGALTDLEKCRKENESLRKLSDNLSSSVAELTESLAKEQKLNKSCQSSVLTAKESLETIQEQLALVVKEKNDYQKWYQKAKKDLKDLDNMTAIQHIIYGLKNLFVKKEDEKQDTTTNQSS